MKLEYAKTVTVKGVQVPKFRGSKLGQVMKDRTKYCRKAKHKKESWL